MDPRLERQAEPTAGTKRARRQERAILKQQHRTSAAAQQRREQFVRWAAAAAVALAAVGVVAWLVQGRITGDVGTPNGLPGPEGGPRVAQDVGTLVGQPAPSFTLADANGTSYTVTPGQGRPLVLVSHMGITWQLCVEQLGELQSSVDALGQMADVYVINSDTPEQSRQLKQISKIDAPVLLDQDLEVARQYDMLPKPSQPMGMMQGVAQMGFVIVDAAGTIRVQRVDVNFGGHASQLLEILRLLEQEATPTPGSE